MIDTDDRQRRSNIHIIGITKANEEQNRSSCTLRKPYEKRREHLISHTEVAHRGNPEQHTIKVLDFTEQR